MVRAFALLMQLVLVFFQRDVDVVPIVQLPNVRELSHYSKHSIVIPREHLPSTCKNRNKLEGTVTDSQHATDYLSLSHFNCLRELGGTEFASRKHKLISRRFPSARTPRIVRRPVFAALCLLAWKLGQTQSRIHRNSGYRILTNLAPLLQGTPATVLHYSGGSKTQGSRKLLEEATQQWCDFVIRLNWEPNTLNETHITMGN